MVMELMNKESVNDGPIMIHDTRRWPPDSKAAKFLLLTDSAYSINELKSVKKPLCIYKLSSNFPKASTDQLYEAAYPRGYRGGALSGGYS